MRKLSVFLALALALCLPAGGLFAADLVITASAVVPGSGATYGQGTAGAAVTAGQALYLDSSNNTIKPADSTTSAKATVVGIAAHAASASQPIRYYTGGAVTVNAVLTQGKFYVLSATSGGGNVAPVADLANPNYSTLLGYANTTTSLQLMITATGVTN